MSDNYILFTDSGADIPPLPAFRMGRRLPAADFSL